MTYNNPVDSNESVAKQTEFTCTYEQIHELWNESEREIKSKKEGKDTELTEKLKVFQKQALRKHLRNYEEAEREIQRPHGRKDSEGYYVRQSVEFIQDGQKVSREIPNTYIIKPEKEAEVNASIEILLETEVLLNCHKASDMILDWVSNILNAEM